MPGIAIVTEPDLDELLPLMRGYCDFYAVSPSDDDLLAMSRALIADPEREGVQLLARDEADRAVGFATIFWSWSTSSAGRLAIMNDLFVHPDARGTGLADDLIMRCAALCRARGDIVELAWQTALDNDRARAVYERVGAAQSRWLDYSLDTRRQ
ncbi:MAG: GNAT family N-acetyltransferase [Nocardioidaceae bacterium]